LNGAEVERRGRGCHIDVETGSRQHHHFFGGRAVRLDRQGRGQQARILWGEFNRRAVAAPGGDGGGKRDRLAVAADRPAVDELLADVEDAGSAISKRQRQLELLADRDEAEVERADRDGFAAAADDGRGAAFFLAVTATQDREDRQDKTQRPSGVTRHHHFVRAQRHA
jgi:hypothetical protein